MTKQEFLNELGGKLSEEMSTSEIMSQVQYYAGYIDGEMARGKTEAEAIEDLGDPILIARTILESPREEDGFFGRAIQDEQDAYFEGTYQGENQKSTEEIRAALRADLPLNEVPAEPEDEPVEEEPEEEPKEEAGEVKYPESDEETVVKEPASGGFRWELFGVILAVVLILTAVLYLAVRVLSAMSPIVIGIIVAAVIGYVVYRARS